MIRRVLPAVALLALAVWVAVASEAQGCGGAFRLGDRVDVADETALIVWDEATKTQHFIRRATFVGSASAYDFGFLVPTPSRPELEAADADLFTELAKITEPKKETRHSTRPFNLGCGMMPTETFMATGNVEVLEQKRVGDLDAAVLGFKPDAKLDPEAAAADLLAWLNRNQYAVRPDLTAWLIPYVRDNWVITAFKIASQPEAPTAGAPKGTARGEPPARSQQGRTLKSSAVRMSFKAERPFFPYREPADQRDVQAKGVQRLLRVFVAAKHRVSGKLGDGSTAWPGMTVWANAVTGAERGSLLAKAKLPAETGPGEWWLTEFEDRSTPRPGTDEVYFEQAADLSPVARPPHVTVVYTDPWWAPLVCLGVPALMAGATLWAVVRLLKRARTRVT